MIKAAISCGAAADVHEDDARLTVRVQQARLGRGQRLEHDARDPHPTVLDDVQQVLDARDGPAHTWARMVTLRGREATGWLTLSEPSST